MNPTRGLSLLVAFAGSLACTNAANTPIVASSADQATYAVKYPDTLAATRGSFSEQESRATRLAGETQAYVADVEPKDWSHVEQAYRLSDSAGKSAAYAERYEQTNGISDFFSEEKDKLNQSVAGNVAYVAKQNDCKEPGNIAGTAAASMGKAVDKQLKERLRSSNEAQAYVDAHAEAIGQKSVEKLRDQVDALTELSYTVHVGVERNRQRLKTLLDESGKVRSTLESTAEDADTLAADSAQPDPDRKAAKARAESARAAAARIESEQKQAQHVYEQTEERIKKLRSDYQLAIDALLKAAHEKGSQAAAKK